MARRLMQEIEQAVDAREIQWGSEHGDAPDAWRMGIRGVKRCRANRVLRDTFVYDDKGPLQAYRNSSFGSGGNVSSARNWRTRWLSELRASCMFKGVHFTGTLASAFDASRIGRPAKDYNLHLMWDCDANELVVAPPKDRQGAPVIQDPVLPNRTLAFEMESGGGLDTTQAAERISTRFSSNGGTRRGSVCPLRAAFSANSQRSRFDCAACS